MTLLAACPPCGKKGHCSQDTKKQRLYLNLFIPGGAEGPTRASLVPQSDGMLVLQVG